MSLEVPPMISPAILFSCWGALVLTAAAFEHFNRNAKLKKAIFPYVGVVTGALFLLLGWLIGLRPPGIYYMACAVFAIMMLNFRVIRFCSKCGKTVPGSTPLTPARSCPRCNTVLS